VILIHQRYRQTDRRTDGRTDGRTTCNLNTALCTSASRGKKCVRSTVAYTWGAMSGCAWPCNLGARGVYPPKANHANCPLISIPLPPSFPSLSGPFPSLYSPFNSSFIFPSPKPARRLGSNVSSPAGSRTEPQPQTHFYASTGLRTHLVGVAASIRFPAFPMTQNASSP